MPHIEIIHDKELEARTGNRQAFTFLVDGIPSMRWFPNAESKEFPNRSADYFVQRCVSRLKDGRSSEAFGNVPTVKVGASEVVVDANDDIDEKKIEEQLAQMGLDKKAIKQVLHVARVQKNKGRGKIVKNKAVPGEVQEIVLGSGKTKKRAARDKFKYVLDGKESVGEFHSEKEARAACSIQAFMSRGKLGKVQELQEFLEKEFPGKKCKAFACAKQHCIRAFVEDKEYQVSWIKVGGVWSVERIKEMI